MCKSINEIATERIFVLLNYVQRAHGHVSGLPRVSSPQVVFDRTMPRYVQFNRTFTPKIA